MHLWLKLSLLWALGLGTSLQRCGGKPPVEQCFVIGDENDNGLADCDDPVCWRIQGACKEKCDDKPNDEDGDGKIGCADSDCWVKGAGCAEVCTGGNDEDGDGAADCSDPDCWKAASGCKEVCSGGNDEDGDGKEDCKDSDCWKLGAGCKELCAGGNDEDGDGLVDCNDGECKGTADCAPSFDKDTKPIFVKHCTGQLCHTQEIAAGGLVVTKYEDMLKPAIYCQGQNKGWCCALRMKEGSMPKDCSGCVSKAEMDLVQAWVDGGLKP